MAICPYFKCKKIIFKQTSLDIETVKPDIVEFLMMCPHCHEKVKVKITAQIQTKPYESN